jgi:hypothetical protein
MDTYNTHFFVNIPGNHKSLREISGSHGGKYEA